MRTGPINLPLASRMVPRFANPALTAYLQTMPKNIELPPRVAQAFARDMRAFFKAESQFKQDEIASRQLHALIPFQRPRDKRLKACGREGDVPADEGSRMTVVHRRGQPRLIASSPPF
jgi:hypothetical protein